MAMALGSKGGRGGARGGGRRGARRTPMAEINVTPFVDVMLVLLIIFMVTAPLLTAGVPVDLPESRANAIDPQQQSVTISIDDAGTIFIDDSPVAQGGLAAALAVLKEESGAGGANAEGGPDITLRADRALDYGRVMLVMGELNRAGLNRISLLTSGSSVEP